MLTRPVPRLVSLALLWVFILIFATTVTATTPYQPLPGTSFETAKSLGLTTTGQTSPAGIHLTTNDNLGYYFYLAPNRDTSLTFTFYTYQPVSTYESRLHDRIALLVVYDAIKRVPIISKSTLTCTFSSSSPSGKACTAKLESSLRRGQRYYLFVDFHTFDDPAEGGLDYAKEYDGWLTWKASSVSGTSALQAWTWFDRNALHGLIKSSQIRSDSEHWYLVNASPGSRLEFSLWGTYSGLNLCIYRADNLVNPENLGCSATAAYPNFIPVTTPKGILGESTLLVQVTNQGVKDSEYYLNYTRK